MHGTLLLGRRKGSGHIAGALAQHVAEDQTEDHMRLTGQGRRQEDTCLRLRLHTGDGRTRNMSELSARVCLCVRRVNTGAPAAFSDAKAFARATTIAPLHHAPSHGHPLGEDCWSRRLQDPTMAPREDRLALAQDSTLRTSCRGWMPRLVSYFREAAQVLIFARML